MDNQPVFDSSEEYQIWRILNGRVTDRILDSVMRNIDAGGQVHPAILISLINALEQHSEGLSTAKLISLAEKVRPQDISPIIKIVNILISRDETKAASEILSNCESKDTFHKS